MRRLLPALTAAIAALALVLAPVPAARGDDEHEAAAGTTHERPEDQILKFDPNLAIWSLVVFAILFAILYRFAWGPLAKALDEREAKNKLAYDEAQLAREEAVRARQDYEAKMLSTGAQVAELLAEARRDAEYAKNDILASANREATEIKDRAVRAIKLAEDEALRNLLTQAAELATLAAGRVLPRTLSDDDHKQLVALALEEIPKLKRGENARTVA